MDWIIEHWDDLMLIVTGIISVASVIVKLTPTPRDDEELGRLRKLLHTMALTPKRPNG